MKTLHQLHLHTPCLILVPDTFLSASDNGATSSGRKPDQTSLLVECIRDEFPFVPLEPVLRRYWNEDAGKVCGTQAYNPLIFLVLGLTFISELCVEDDERAATLVASSQKCIYALLSYQSALLTCKRYSHQILCPLGRVCSIQACRNQVEHSICTRFPSYSFYARRWQYDDRPRDHPQSRIGR